MYKQYQRIEQTISFVGSAATTQHQMHIDIRIKVVSIAMKDNDTLQPINLDGSFANFRKKMYIGATDKKPFR